MGEVPIEWNGRVRGVYETSNRTYYKKIKPEHYAYKPEGYGIQKEIIEELAERRCERIVLECYTSRGYIEYETEFSNYLDCGDEETLNDADGEQVFLNIDYWKKR